MKTNEFVELVKAAKLDTSEQHAPQFVIALSIATGYDTHVETETLIYEPAEFSQLTTDRAQSQIEMVRKKLVKAATEKLRTAL
jgi:hypothetical protein